MTAISARHGTAARTARVISPAPRQVWQSVWRADPEAMATQSPEWLDAVCAGGAYPGARRCYHLPGGRTLVLPLLAPPRAGGRLTGASFPPRSGCGGLVA